MQVQVRLLGPVDLTVSGVPTPVAGLRRRATLAALALHPGEAISVDRLLDIVWANAIPATAGEALQSHISRLRRLLGDRAAILSRPPGYLLELGDDATDVHTAQRLIRADQPSADPVRREAQLKNAIDLWRGPALANVSELAWFDDHARRLEHLFLEARRALIDTRLILGQHAELLPELENLIGRYPHDEQLYGWLMLAQYRAGRQGEALATYRRLRQTLDDELGIGPSRALRDLEAAVLQQDPTLDPPPPRMLATSSPSSAVKVIPAQLPAAVTGFAGRDAELAHLNALIAHHGRDRSTGDDVPTGDDDGRRVAAVVISAMSGTAGVGKTTLAVHWAHRLASQFPDGQLYVNLRGFDPSGSVLDPAEALSGFLEAFAVSADLIPAGVEAKAALYRSLLAGKRVLIVLDNARDVQQVRPLLPGEAGCFTIVTSRNHLTPLVATEGASALTLTLLSPAEARDLLTRRLGAGRAAKAPEAIEEIITRCARLPLALAIAAARAATHPEFPLAALAAELRQTPGGLDALDGGDPGTDVRAVFSWSYQSLSDDAGRLFRLLGLHPGSDLAEPAAASLAGIPLPQARTLLTELARAHLLSQPTPGRYTFHDLLRAYAGELAHAHDSAQARRAAEHRLLDHYLHTAHAGALLLAPHWQRISLPAPQPGVILGELDGHTEAYDWFSAERRVLLAVVDHAGPAGFDPHAWQLSWSLAAFLLLKRADWGAHIAVHQSALAAARRLGDRLAQAHTLQGLGLGYLPWQRTDDAERCFQQALALFTELGDTTGRAHAYNNLCQVALHRSDLTLALKHAEHSLDLFTEAGDGAWQAFELNAVGWVHAQLGDYQRAVFHCQQAVTQLQDLGVQHGQADIWDSLGYAYRGLGDHERAATCYQRAIDLYGQHDERHHQAETLVSLGDLHCLADNPAGACQAWQQAFDIFDQLASAREEADQLRERLSKCQTTLKVQC